MVTYDGQPLICIIMYFRCTFRREFYAYWSPPSEFSEILMQRNMFNDHLPKSLQKAFKELRIQEKI